MVRYDAGAIYSLVLNTIPFLIKYVAEFIRGDHSMPGTGKMQRSPVADVTLVAQPGCVDGRHVPRISPRRGPPALEGAPRSPGDP